jgi:hypothetical protein
MPMGRYRSPKFERVTLQAPFNGVGQPMTQKEKIGGFLNGAQRELADQKAQPNPDQNAIAISERAVQRWQFEYDRFPKE